MTEVSPSPKKTLTLFDLTCIGINAIVGSGIYAFPGHLATMLGRSSFLAFAACGFASILVGLCFAEAASGFERSGGPYLYSRTAFGNTTGFIVGWSCWAAAILSWAAVTNALIPYTTYLFGTGVPGFVGPSVGIFITLVLGAVNYLGIKPGAYTTDILTVVKLIPLVVLVGVGFFSFDTNIWRAVGDMDLSTLPKAAFMAFFAFQGFEVVPVPAGDSTNPRRNAPLAVLISVAGATILYVAIQISSIGSTSGLAGSNEPLALMGTVLLGQLGGQIVAVAAVLSMLGFCAGVALAGPRYVEALAFDGFLPQSIANRHPKFGTPHRAIFLTTILTSLFVVLVDFHRLVDLSVSIVAIQYLSTCAAILVLRKKQTDTKFHLPWGPTIPILALAVVIVFIGIPAIQNADSRHILSLIVLIGVGGIPAVFWKWKRRI
ncbi:MAG: amino acid permease [Pseudomonadota bacterium]